MTETVKISEDNRITLSAETLALLGVKAGDRVDIVGTEDGHLEIRPRRLTFSDLKGMVKLERPVTTEELDRWAAEARGGVAEGDDDR
jgi:AbrB family looped-hinge helix DNA binding protein